MSGSTSLPVAQDWAQWAQGGFMPPADNGTSIAAPAAVTPPAAAPAAPVASPTQMPTYDDAAAASSTTPFSQTLLGRAAGAIGNAYSSLAGPPTSHGQPMPPPPAAPPAPPPGGATPAEQAALPVPPVPPPGGPPAAPVPAPGGSGAPTPPPGAGQQMPPIGQPQNDNSQADATTLNIKRNNPLNIRFANQPGAANVGGFAQFPSVQDGYNAATTLMGKYADGGINTLSGLINKWAPKGDGDNNPDAYIAAVSKQTGIDPQAKIDLHDPAIVGLITPAMARVESGTAGGGGQGPMLASTQAQPSTTPGGSTPLAGGLPGMGANGMGALGDYLPGGKLPYSNAETQLPGGSKLLALAAGILSGRSLGEGLGKGLANLNQTQAADIANKRASNSQALQLANIGMQNDRYSAMLGLQNNRLGIQANAPAGPQQITTDANGNKVYMTPLKNGGFRQDPGPTGAVQGMTNRSDAPLQGQIASDKVAATVPVKENAEDIDNMLETGANAPQKAMQLDQLQKLVASGQAGSGPGLQAMKRGIANYFNVDLSSIGGPTATGAQLAGAIASQTRGSGIMGKNMRTQREFNTVMEGLPNMDQNPQVLGSVINGLKNFNDYQQTASQNWLALPSDQRQALRTDQDKFQSWQQGQLSQWRDKVQKNGGLYGQGSQPAQPSQAAQAAPVTGSYKGMTYSFTPGN